MSSTAATIAAWPVARAGVGTAEASIDVGEATRT
jgi:hypothetical protein